MDLAGLLYRSGRSAGEYPALALGDHLLCDYRTFASRAARLGWSLRNRLGLEAGDRVALAMKNCPAYLEVLFGAWWGGLAVVPMNAKLHTKEFAYMLEHSGAKLCFVTPDLESSLSQASGGIAELKEMIDVASPAYGQLFQGEELAYEARLAEEMAWLFYTSGTTGRPKGAMLSHANLLAMTSCYFADVDSISPGESILHAAPISHGSGIYSLPHVAQAALQVIPESGGFDPGEVFRLFEHHRGMSFFFAPTMVKRLVEAPGAGEARLANFKTCIYGGGPMYVADVKKAIEVFGNRFVQIYGQGESPMTITALSRQDHANKAHPRYEERLASVGRAQMLVEIRVVDETGRDLPAGETGEILVRGASVMLGYWDNAEATAKSIVDGWLHSGDMGSFDEEGFLTLKDRSKDVIISGGTNIYPREVEEVLLRHPAVLECSVIGRAHPDWGEEVVAFVVAREGHDLTGEDLDRLCLAEIARFKRPKSYRFLDRLPKNNYGKILKTALRNLKDEV